MRRGLYFWCLLVAWLWPAWAGAAVAAGTGVIELGARPTVSLDGRSLYWVDETGERTVDQVEARAQALTWRPRVPGLQLHLDDKALWIQFDAIVPHDERWFLEIGSSGLDRGQLFHRGPDGRWVRQEAGDTRPVSAWPLPGRLPTFRLSHETGKPVRYWLRIEHNRVDFASPIVLRSQQALFEAREREQFLLGGYFALAGLIALYALANAVAYRDRGFAAYAVYVSVLGLGQLAYLGVGAQHLWIEWLRWNELAPSFLTGLSAVAGLWFVKTITEPARFSRVLDLAVWSLILALLSSVAVDAAVNSRTSFMLMAALTLLSLVVVMGLIAMVWTQGDDPHIRLVALGFLPVLVMALFPVARSMNWMPNSDLTRYGVAIGAVLEMPILLYALSRRGNRRRDAEVRAAALSRHDALTGLAHRRALLQRMENALARARSLKHGCALLAIRISNLEAIQQEFGRDTAEKALVVTASHLRRAISDIDMAARVGEHDFAVLIEGPTTLSVAASRAQQVVASGLRPMPALPMGATFKYHVAVAMLPEGELDAESTLDWALEEAARIPADARKLIRTLNLEAVPA